LISAALSTVEADRIKTAFKLLRNKNTVRQIDAMIYLRTAIVSFGLLVAALGVYAWVHGNYWYTTYNPRLGQFGTGPTLMFVFFGLFIVLFGLYSRGWEEISPRERKQFERKSRKKPKI
jgi:1,4-dihydroxy-2-naphthoate octaprenyltransferase